MATRARHWPTAWGKPIHRRARKRVDERLISESGHRTSCRFWPFSLSMYGILCNYMCNGNSLSANNSIIPGSPEIPYTQPPRGPRTYSVHTYFIITAGPVELHRMTTKGFFFSSRVHLSSPVPGILYFFPLLCRSLLIENSIASTI